MKRGLTIAGGDSFDAEAAAVLLNCSAEFMKGEFGVVARGGGLRDRGLPFGEQSRKKDGGFDLGARHRHLVMDRAKPPAMNFERREIVVAPADVRAHLAKRGDHSLHRALLQRSIAGDFGVEGLSREDAGEEANRGAGIFGVQSTPGALEALGTVAGNLCSRTVERDPRTEGPDAVERALAIAGGSEVSKFAGAFGERGKHGIAVRDRLVAGEFEAAREGVDRPDSFRFHDGASLA